MKENKTYSTMAELMPKALRQIGDWNPHMKDKFYALADKMERGEPIEPEAETETQTTKNQ